jgi:Mycothiol maleylpyruvate isomerase N-terminal domain
LASKQEIIEALRRIEKRLDELAPRITENLDRPLLTGTWTVHDAVCHLAADANGVPGFMERMDRVAKGLPRRDPGFNGDEYNEANISQRKDKPVEEVFAEIRAGLEADRERIAALEEGLLERELPNVRGEVLPVSDQMRAYLGGHPVSHLEDIEKALAAGS